MEEKTSGLIDIQKYLTTVNETHLGNFRKRQTVTEFLYLASGDQGLFQCVAHCERGEEAMGHFINITVKGRPASHCTYDSVYNDEQNTVDCCVFQLKCSVRKLINPLTSNGNLS